MATMAGIMPFRRFTVALRVLSTTIQPDYAIGQKHHTCLRKTRPFR